MTVREAQQRIDSREFLEWQIYWELEPFRSQELQLAQQSAMFYNANRRKGAPAHGVEDFHPAGRIQKPKKKSKKQLRASMMGWLAIDGDGNGNHNR
jgi:hypothetical protein